MTIENGGEQPANDTVVADQNAASQVAADNQADQTEGEDTEAEDQLQDDEEELDVDGEKFRIPRKLREAIAKPFQRGFTEKTQELAEKRKALDGELDGFTKKTAAQRAHIETYAKVISAGERITELEGPTGLGKYQNVDWVTLANSDPAAYQQHRAIYDSLKDQRDNIKNQRDTAARAWTEKEQEYVSNANREHGERVAKAQAEIAKHVEGWAPGNELDQKLMRYAIAELKLPATELGDAAMRVPQLVKELNRLRVYDEAAKKQKTQQTFEQTQQAKPATRVGGGGSATTRRTTDASGDTLSTDEWIKRERERVRKKA